MSEPINPFELKYRRNTLCHLIYEQVKDLAVDDSVMIQPNHYPLESERVAINRIARENQIKLSTKTYDGNLWVKRVL